MTSSRQPAEASEPGGRGFEALAPEALSPRVSGPDVPMPDGSSPEVADDDSLVAFAPQEIPVSCGAILLDPQGRLLVLRPTYKSGWTIPGGVMQADGETPWQACRREVLEETGLHVEGGRLVCVDTRPAKQGRKLGLRFLFHCGQLRSEQLEEIVLDALEIAEHRFVPVEEAMQLLRKPVRRRVRRGLRARRCVYLENGRPVDAVS